VYELTDNTGLLLEGGGMRCAYTAGVLDFFLDHQIEFAHVATASAGAIIGSSFIAKQRERNYHILKLITQNNDFISFKRMMQEKELFGMDFIFDKIPNQLAPLDFDSFANSNTTFSIGTTDINTGYPLYFDNFDTKEDLFTVTRASCSLPVLASSTHYKGNDLMDGGVSDPIPIRPLMAKGLKKHVVVLTRNRGYVKKRSALNWLYKIIFKNKPALKQLLHDRHILYNQTMEKLLEMEKRNEVFIIQPEMPLVASRIEKDNHKLEDLYIQGYREAEQKEDALKEFLHEPINTEKSEEIYLNETVPL